MSASVGSRRAGSKAWGGWGAVAVVVLLSVSSANAQGGTFTDKRDGKTYRTVKIGKQRWMAENLNYKTERSVCYDNDESNCKKYGRLYNWNDAMKACPAGWHLPSDEEWTALVNSAGGDMVAGKKLKSKSGWEDNGNGTDDYGFSALPGGPGASGSFYNASNYGFWWSATEDITYSAWGRYMSGNYDDVGRSDNFKTDLYSVRCVEGAAP